MPQLLAVNASLEFAKLRKLEKLAIHADGGCLAAQHGSVWRATAVFRRGQWSDHAVIWLPETGLPGDGARSAEGEGVSRSLDAPIQIGAPVGMPGGAPPCQLVVFRAVHGPFTVATADVLMLAALHLTTALYVAAGVPPSTVEELPAARRGGGA